MVIKNIIDFQRKKREGKSTLRLMNRQQGLQEQK